MKNRSIFRIDLREIHDGNICSLFYSHDDLFDLTTSLLLDGN